MRARFFTTRLPLRCRRFAPASLRVAREIQQAELSCSFRARKAIKKIGMHVLAAPLIWFPYLDQRLEVTASASLANDNFHNVTNNELVSGSPGLFRHSYSLTHLFVPLKIQIMSTQSSSRRLNSRHEVALSSDRRERVVERRV